MCNPCNLCKHLYIITSLLSSLHHHIIIIIITTSSHHHHHYYHHHHHWFSSSSSSLHHCILCICAIHAILNLILEYIHVCELRYAYAYICLPSDQHVITGRHNKELQISAECCDFNSALLVHLIPLRKIIPHICKCCLVLVGYTRLMMLFSFNSALCNI